MNIIVILLLAINAYFVAFLIHDIGRIKGEMTTIDKLFKLRNKNFEYVKSVLLKQASEEEAKGILKANQAWSDTLIELLKQLTPKPSIYGRIGKFLSRRRMKI